MKKGQSHLQDIPAAFLERMASLLADEYSVFHTSLHAPPVLGMRVNTLKISPEKFIRISPYELTSIPWCSSGFTLDDLAEIPGYISPGKHIFHLAGLYYLQEPSAMAAAEVLAPQPGERILDLAAAPGGKSSHLAALMNNSGLLVANEIHPKRVWDLAENLERCGVTNAIITNNSPERLSEHFVEFFDRVMLDAPCSGEGMFRKSANAREEWRPEIPHHCSIRQHTILDYAARMVKVGGSLAYTTCTFSPDENEGVVARFLENHPEFDVLVIDQKPGFSPAKPEWVDLPLEHKINRSIRIWPHQSKAEGHFIALFLKNNSSNNGAQKRRTIKSLLRKPKNSLDSVSAVERLDDFSRKHLNSSFEKRDIHIHGSYIYLQPENLPNLDGLHVIHPGWWLGFLQKNRFIPSHALAMGINTQQAKYFINLQPVANEIKAYLKGESFHNTGDDAWVLVSVDGFPIGWGKRINNIIKNFYPHGLRQN